MSHFQHATTKSSKSPAITFFAADDAAMTSS
jgi:hypothetical protein